MSYIATPRMKTIRAELSDSISEQYILSYADRPDCLFKSVHQKQCILIGKKKKQKCRVFTGNYQYWYKAERDILFEQTATVENDFVGENYIPKLGTSLDVKIYQKVIQRVQRIALTNMPSEGAYTVYVNMRAAFWIKAFRKYHESAEYKRFNFETSEIADYFFCILNSSLFWWYWICVSDCWHITNKEISGFMIPVIEHNTIISALANALEDKLEDTKEYVGTKQTKYEYKHKACVKEIHAIDDYINELFGLTDKESLYVKKFAIKYRASGGIE